MTIQEYLQKLTELCGVEVDATKVELVEDGDRLRIILELPETDTNLFIGSHGETLDSIELITRMAFQESYPDKKIVLDIGNYRKQREERLQEKALSIAASVLETGREYSFGLLNSYERYLVHTAIASTAEFADLETVSEDTEAGRVLFLRVKAKESGIDITKSAAFVPEELPAETDSDQTE